MLLGSASLDTVSKKRIVSSLLHLWLFTLLGFDSKMLCIFFKVKFLLDNYMEIFENKTKNNIYIYIHC